MATALGDTNIFGPLLFESETEDVTCLVCDNTFNVSLRFDIFLKHLLEVHQVVIEDVQNIKKLSEYLQYWKSRIKENSIEELIPAVRVDSTDQLFFVFSTLLKEDKDLRHRLQLEYVLKVQEFERSDISYNRLCLFCKLNFEGTRHDFIAHLASQHNLQLGNPQNLVFIEEMIEKIDEKLNNLKCLYCDKTFPDRPILKEHMRKKLHKRINQSNREFDKYYIVNYLEPGKNWRSLQKEHDKNSPDLNSNSDDEYSDWHEKADTITCLFCSKTESDINLLCLHMEADHNFDFANLTKDFDFYQRVKLVNFIRRQIHNNKCPFCDRYYENRRELEEHLYEEKHCKLPDLRDFDQPEFYFPTYENDAFLYLIDDVEDM